MTTITPAGMGTVRYTAELISPFHHGAGSSGNTSLLRTQEVLQSDGTTARIPFLSAASIRHALRDRLAWHAAETLELKPGALSKLGVDLLWSGGAVTTTGAEVDLGLSRRIDDVFPALGLFGFAAKSDIHEGTLRVSDLILVCAENASRLPTGLPLALLRRRAAAFRSEEFGTRHDVASTPVGRLVGLADDLIGGKPAKTAQMIFDVQTLKSGAVMSGSIWVTAAATAGQRMALGAALALWAHPDADGAPTAHLGAKTAAGYGAARLRGLPDTSADLAAWTDYIFARRDEILALIADLTS